MGRRKRRHLPESLKREAVERVRTSGLPICRVAEELDVHETVLRRWMARCAEPGTGPARRSVTQAQGPSPADLAAESARLKRDPQRAQMERDILENAALIFGTASR
ncbi:transposase [Rubrimonas cliftonensis]|uniref:Transposase n=1 Tax=Rubrimonas cliftonensis TaxID=89524 RepID=A0A1H4DK79_9RHOB|nr:transposase [Rubrimonas cliftonensis]